MKKKPAKKKTTPKVRTAKALRLKRNAVAAELAVTEATAETFRDIERRLKLLEKVAGLPGPRGEKGEKGEPGPGFWNF